MYEERQISAPRFTFRNSDMNKSNKVTFIIALLCIVSILSYFKVFQQYWFMKLLGGYVVKIWVPNLLILSLVIMKYLRTDRGRKLSFKKDSTYPLMVTILILFVWDLIALYSHGEGWWYIGKSMLVTFSPICLFIAIVSLVKNDSTLDRILGLLFLCGLMMAANLELRYFSGDPSFEPLVTNQGDVIDPWEDYVQIYSTERFYRHGEPALGINTYSAMLIPLPLIGLYLGRKSSRLLFKGYYFLCSAFLLYALVATMTRATFIGLVVGAFVMFLFQFFRSSKIKLLFYFLLFCLFTLSLLSYYPGMKIRMLRLVAATKIPGTEFAADQLYQTLDLRREQEAIFIDAHFGRIGETFDYIRESPIFGVGWIRQFIVNEHNHYLQQAAIYGLVSIAVYIILLASIVVITLRVLLKTMRRNPSDASPGILLFSCTIAFLTYLNASPGENLYCWVLFGLTVAWAKYTHEMQRNMSKYRINL